MAYSYTEYTANGSTTTFAIPFTYTLPADVSVFVDGVSTSFTFTSTSVASLSTAPASGSLVRVARTTSLTSRAVDFSNGAVLTESDLDSSNIQVFQAAQEAIDTADAAISKAADGKMDAQGRVIKNVANPTSAQDAVTKSWAESGMTSQLNIATTKASEASTSASNASASESAAASSATYASTSASTATTKASVATTQATTATTQASTATTQATTATNQATAALNSATAAANSEAGVTASASTATTKASEASVSAGTASTQAGIATTKASEASTSETNASGSATAAASSASSITGAEANSANSATAAAGSASTAGTHASTATTQAGIATTKASEAATSATNAAASLAGMSSDVTASAANAAAAATSLDSFQDIYLGTASANPTTDLDGDALVAGALHYNTTANSMRVYSGSSWADAGSAVNGTSDRVVYTATAAQTTFAVTYDAGFVDVYLNGIKLLLAVDFAGTSGTSVVLTTGATVGDIVDIVSFGSFALADHYTKVASDARYLAPTGDGSNLTGITDTTYSIGDGGLTQVNFTTADNTKLDGIAVSANNYTLPATLPASMLTGALPAISGEALTNLPASGFSPLFEKSLFGGI